MGVNRFKHVPGGKWATSVYTQGVWVHIVENSYLYDPSDATTILHALGIPSTEENLDRYFPYVAEQGRCPTNELLELTHYIDPFGEGYEKANGGRSSV